MLEQKIRDGDTTINLSETDHMTLSDRMLRFPFRDYIIEKAKAPLRKFIEAIAKRWPTPTRQNCRHPNTFVWMDILEDFLAHEDNPGRLPMFEAFVKIWLDEHEHDHSYYGVRMDYILERWLDQVLKGNYKPRSTGYPNQCWKPDERGEGFRLIQFCYSRRRQGRPIDLKDFQEGK